jgi:hypothetical protein
MHSRSPIRTIHLCHCNDEERRSRQLDRFARKQHQTLSNLLEMLLEKALESGRDDE